MLSFKRASGTIRRKPMQVLQLSLPRLQDVLASDSLRARHGVSIGRIRSRSGNTVGVQQWPYDYLVVLLDGHATARDGTGYAATLIPGQGALWHAHEHWRVDVVDDMTAITLQADDLDSEFLSLLKPSSSEIDQES